MSDKPSVSRPITAVLQRLLGAVILIAAAALLVPLLLDGQGLRQTTEKPDIPVEPAFDVRLGDSGQPEVRLLDVKGEVERDLAPLAAGEPGSSEGIAAPEAVVPTEGASSGVAIEDGLPLEPQPKTVPATSALPPQAIPSVAAAKAPAAKVVIPPPATDAKKSAEQTALSEAWMLQLGAFKDKANAQKTVALLQAKGFRATTNSRTPGVVKVQVGPELRRDRAEALRQRVLSSTGMAGVLVRFQP